jgi:hypothetical protein
MFFNKKKSKPENIKKPENNNDIINKKVHKYFQYCGFLVLVFIIYNIYFSDIKSDAVLYTESEIEEKALEAWDKLANSEEFKNVKNFTDELNKNADKTNGNIINYADGIIIYIPNQLVNKILTDNSNETSELSFDLNNIKALVSIKNKNSVSEDFAKPVEIIDSAPQQNSSNSDKEINQEIKSIEKNAKENSDLQEQNSKNINEIEN